jgi:hypothetical protein
MSRLELRFLPAAVGLLILALGLAACASGSGGSASGGGSADVITQQQIDEAGLDTALEVVRRYRPRWLQPTRTPSSASVVPLAGRPGMPQDGGDTVANEVQLAVFLDGVRYGDMNSLSSISPRTVSSIQFINSADARTRYGAGYEGGVIEVRSR